MCTRPRARLGVGLALLLGVAAACHPLRAEIVDTKLVYDDSRKGLGHQGVTKGSGGTWYVTHNGQLFRYDTDDFGVGQSALVRNEKAFDHADFRGTPFDHLGAPEYHDGNVYTFAKHGAYPPRRFDDRHHERPVLLGHPGKRRRSSSRGVEAYRVRRNQVARGRRIRLPDANAT